MTERTAAEALAEALEAMVDGDIGEHIDTWAKAALRLLERLDAIGWHLTMTDDLR